MMIIILLVLNDIFTICIRDSPFHHMYIMPITIIPHVFLNKSQLLVNFSFKNIEFYSLLNLFLKELGGFVLKVMKSIFCFYLVEPSLGFQIMCRLCIFDSPSSSQGLSNMENNLIQYIAILIVFRLYLMLGFVQICRPYTFLIVLSLLFNTSYDSILFILVGSNFNPIFLKIHRFSSIFSTWTLEPQSKFDFFGFK